MTSSAVGGSSVPQADLAADCFAPPVKAAATIIFQDRAPLIVVWGTSHNIVPLERVISCNKTS